MAPPTPGLRCKRQGPAAVPATRASQVLYLCQAVTTACMQQLLLLLLLSFSWLEISRTQTSARWWKATLRAS